MQFLFLDTSYVYSRHCGSLQLLGQGLATLTLDKGQTSNIDKFILFHYDPVKLNTILRLDSDIRATFRRVGFSEGTWMIYIIFEETRSHRVGMSNKVRQSIQKRGNERTSINAKRRIYL